MAVDWWTLGILIYELLTGAPPFVGSTPFEIFTKICELNFTFPSNFDDTAKDLICSFLRAVPNLRLGAKPYNAISNTGGIIDIKTHKFFEGIDWTTLEKREFNFIGTL